jgi:periplasmic divalent cation tolerance protein
MMMEFVQVSTTIDTEPAAQAIATALIERRLAACVHVSGPVRSVYRWQNAVQEADEWLCTAKTHATLFPQVETAIRELHNYECPEIVAVPFVAGSAAYLQWLGEQLE